jgi:hypothetical protein
MRAWRVDWPRSGLGVTVCRHTALVLHPHVTRIHLRLHAPRPPCDGVPGFWTSLVRRSARRAVLRTVLLA